MHFISDARLQSEVGILVLRNVCFAVRPLVTPLVRLFIRFFAPLVIRPFGFRSPTVLATVRSSDPSGLGISICFH